MKYIELIALFMIILILSISFNTSFVLASFPENYESAGEVHLIKVYDPVNNLHPVIQTGQQGQMEVTINQAGIAISDISFEGIPFNNCVPTGTGETKCFLSFSPPALCGGNLQYKDFDPIPVPFILDGLAPAVDSISISPVATIDGVPVVGEGNLDIRYTNLRDEAECGGCAEVKELKVYADSFAPSKIVGTAQFDRHETPICENGDGTITVPASDLVPANTAREKDLFIQVCDYLDQCSEDIVTLKVMVDRKKPDVEAELLLANDQPATYFQSGLTYKIRAILTDDSGIDFNTLSIDISEFSPASMPTPIVSNNTVTWTFTAQSSTAPAYYDISIEDNAGNLQVHRETLNLLPDNNAPNILDIRTSTSYNSINYMSTETDIIIEVTDDVSGVDPSTIDLDLSDVSSTYSTAEHPTFCNETGTMTTCIFSSLQTSKTTGTVQFSARISDRAGNQASPRTEQIIIDRTAPANPTISQTLTIPTAADEGVFGFRISAVDSNPIIVSADLSEFSDSEVFNVTCEDPQDCIMIPPDLNPVWGDFTVHFIISDIAGNSVEKDYQFTLFELAQCSLQGDGMVSISVGDPIPSKLDRRLASSQTSARLFFPMTVTHADTVIASDYTISTCREIQGVTLGGYQVLSQTTDTPFLVLSAAIGSGQTPANIPIECNISIQIAHNGVKCDQPEQESFSKTIELYNDALGDLGGAADDKLDAIDRRINKIQNDIDGKEKGIEYLGYWCDIAYTIYMADVVIEAAKVIIWGVACILENIPYTKSAGQAIWQAVCKLINSWAKLSLSTVFWSKYYLPIGEGSDEFIGIVSKYICMVLACKFCNIDEIIAVGMGAAGEISKAGANSDFSGAEDKAAEASDSAQASGRDQAYADYSGEVDDINSRYDTLAEGSSGDELKSINNQRQAELNQAGDRYKGKTGRTDTYSGEDLRRLGTKDYYRFGSSKNQGRTDLWQDLGQSTKLQRDIDSAFVESEFTWDPFRSIHYAEACFCHRGMVYNWRKEKEITCAYRNCVKKHLQLGLPTSSCDDLYKEMECLYVDSAEYRLHGFNFWENLLDAALDTLVYYTINEAFEAICGDYYKEADKCTDQVCSQGAMPALCGIAEALMNMLEFVDVYDDPYEQFQDRDLEQFFCNNEDAIPTSSVVEDWYGVEDWELEVCQKWGGGGVEEGFAHGSFATTGSGLQSTTLTVQAQKTVYPDETKSLYEVAWYVEPSEGTITYSIIMQGPTNTKDLVQQGSASPNTPGKNYHSEELTAEYDRVILTIPGQTINIPIACVNCVE